MKLAYAVASPETADPHMLALRGDPAGAFALLGRLGYQGIDLMARDPVRPDPVRLRSLAADAGLAFASISTGQAAKEEGLSLAALDAGARARGVGRGRALVELAAALGAQVDIGTFRGALPDDGPARLSARAAARDSLLALLDHAHARNVRIALEPQAQKVISWLNTVGGRDRRRSTHPGSGAKGDLLAQHRRRDDRLPARARPLERRDPLRRAPRRHRGARSPGGAARGRAGPGDGAGLGHRPPLARRWPARHLRAARDSAGHPFLRVRLRRVVAAATPEEAAARAARALRRLLDKGVVP